MPSAPIDTIRASVVGICGQNHKVRGHGLLLNLEENGVTVLTCHHIVALFDREELQVAIGLLPDYSIVYVPAHYDDDHSSPKRDIAVLKVKDEIKLLNPRLYSLDRSYSGTFQEQAIAYNYAGTGNFEGGIRTARVNFDVKLSPSDKWKTAESCQLPYVFPLTRTTNTSLGTSGSVATYGGKIFGLVHFARSENSDVARESYIVPLSTWAEKLPELRTRIQPLYDPRLTATIKPASALEIETDIIIARRGYEPDVYIEREIDRRAEEILKKRRALFIVGRPESGKSRLALQLLNRVEVDAVVIPESPHLLPDGFDPAGLSGKRLALFIDDLHDYPSIADPFRWREKLEKVGASCLLVCTSRDGNDWQTVREGNRRISMEELHGSIIYTSKTVDGGEDFSDVEGKQLAAQLGLTPKEFQKRFGGTPGSLTLGLKEMTIRYTNLRNQFIGDVSLSRFLDSVKILYFGMQDLTDEMIRLVAEEIRGKCRMNDEVWERLRRETVEQGFITFNPDNGVVGIYIHFLEQCVEYVPSKGDVGKLEGILERIANIRGLTLLSESFLQRYNDAERAEKILRKIVQDDESN